MTKSFSASFESIGVSLTALMSFHQEFASLLSDGSLPYPWLVVHYRRNTCLRARLGVTSSGRNPGAHLPIASVKGIVHTLPLRTAERPIGNDSPIKDVLASSLEQAYLTRSVGSSAKSVHKLVHRRRKTRFTANRQWIREPL